MSISKYAYEGKSVYFKNAWKEITLEIAFRVDARTRRIPIDHVRDLIRINAFSSKLIILSRLFRVSHKQTVTFAFTNKNVLQILLLRLPAA